MTHQTGVNKTAALDELYDRIKQVAVAMSGSVCRVEPVFSERDGRDSSC
jgi:hypothetical protein